MLIPIIGWLLFGLIVGALARFAYPGRQDIGLMKTTLLGIVGSFVGGFLSYLMFGGNAFQASGWIGSIIGAVIVLAIFMQRSKTTVSKLS